MLNKDIRQGMTYVDQARLALNSYSEREINLTISDFAAKHSLPVEYARSSLYWLEKKGEIELIRNDSVGRYGKKQIIGIKINKLQSPKAILDEAVETSKAKQEQKTVKKATNRFPNITSYLEKRMAVLKAKSLLDEVGVEYVIEYAEDPIAEEALDLLNEYIDLQKKKFSETIEQKKEEALHKDEAYAALAFAEAVKITS